MRYIDQHVHTDSSPDSDAPMSQMVEAAEQAGLEAICFTDHCDLIHHDRADTLDLECYSDWGRSVTAYNAIVKEYRGNTEIRIGMELGEINQDTERAKACYMTEGIDFILGSVHSVRGHMDFCMLDYNSRDECLNIAEQYLDESIESARLGYFDVMAHIGYTNRYMKPHGIAINYCEQFSDKLRTLFDIIIYSGKGIELNTSGLRQGTGSTFPDIDMIELYREMGGEIITLGSDAHRPQDVGANIIDGAEILLDSGFKYLAVFEGRKPNFLKL